MEESKHWQEYFQNRVVILLGFDKKKGIEWPRGNEWWEMGTGTSGILRSKSKWSDLEHRKFFCPTEAEGGSRGLGFNILIFKNCQKTRFANIVVSHCDKSKTIWVWVKNLQEMDARESLCNIFSFSARRHILQ
jgi:hypothetical protein